MKSQKLHNDPFIILFWSLPSISKLQVSKEKCNKLNQAIAKMKPVEIVTTRDDKIRLSRIGLDMGKFYGFRSFKGSVTKVLLNLNDIKTIILL